MTTTRGNFWSVTINNPTADDEECIALARQKGWTVEGQLEKVGTPHYQLAVRTPQVRFSAVKKTFPRAHIELARNAAALKQYVHKEETRVGELPTKQDKYPSLSKYWDLVLKYLTIDDTMGLDYTGLMDDAYNCVITFYRESRQRIYETTPLVLLDEATKWLITEGYFVEHHACNPQVRQQWKLFSREILARAWEKHVRESKTDRQTDSVQSAEIPVVGENTTTQDADDSSQSQASSGVLGQVDDDTEITCTSSGSSDEEGSDEDC